MKCPACQFDNPAEARRCARCNASIDSAATVSDVPLDSMATVTEVTGARRRTFPSAGSALTLSEVTAGTVIGERYEILRLLGEGGMGAVYQAKDREVDRLIALKVIRPEFANQPEILNRFKQELILARQITHKNVIRIFDLGQANGIKFITMEFVEGADLHSLRNRGQSFTVEEKVRIAVQICRALEAAHAEGVVHRDLKPHNIMVENSGRVVVMDFGIARSMENTGATSTGALIGTPAYMSPEQAQGEKIDTRSDLFSFGIVFYELLTGVAPYQAETAVGLLLKRVQERPVPPIERNRDIPQALSDVVVRCLVANREQRYQTAAEILCDLEGWQGSPTTFRTTMRPGSERLGKSDEGRTIVTPAMTMMAKSSSWKWVALALAALIVATAGMFAVMRFRSKPATPHSPVAVMIADFNNHTGDPVFDGTLEPMLKIALEGASFINAYDRSKMRDLGVQAVSVKLDEPAARQVAVNQGLGVVVSGSLDREGSGYTFSLKAIQTVTGNAITTAEEKASNKDQVLFTVTKAAAALRKALGDATSESDQLFAMETLTAGSLEAVHEYAKAMDALAGGRHQEGLQGFSKAADLDANFGLAYAGMSVEARNLGQRQDAEKYIRQAIAHIDRMTERERYRTRGHFYSLLGNQQKCVEEFSALISRFPSDTMAHNSLALCASQLRNMPQAIEEMRRSVEILPKQALFRFNLAVYSDYGGDFKTGEREARMVQQLNRNYRKGYVALAFAELGQGMLSQAGEAYQQLEKIDASYAASGFADLALYEGRFAEAVRILEKGAAADVANKALDAAANKFAALAYTQWMRGQKASALAAAESALTNSKTPSVRFLAARIFAAAGEVTKAQTLASSLVSELQPEPQAFGKLVEGEIALTEKKPREALKAFTEANAMLDTWIGRFGLGRAYFDAGAFAEADSEFDRCIKRRGEAMALLLDEIPTYGYFPAVYYYQGRVREGLKTAGFVESYRTYLAIREKAGEDPLLVEIRRRVAQ